MSGAKDFSEDFMVEDAPPGGRQRAGSAGSSGSGPEREADPHRLAQRQKQVDLGKNTVGYQRYRTAVPRDRRNRKTDPVTPDVYQVCSKRAFDGQIKKWRRMLHTWDLPEGQQGGPALLPVQEDVSGPAAAANPPPPADADATSPKNGAGLRLGGGNLPLKIPSAMRKRAYDETMASSENHQLQPLRQQSLRAGSAQPVRGGGPSGAKQARRSEDGQENSNGGAAAAAKTPAGAASEPSWAEQRYTDPQLDYGGEEDDDEGWQHVAPAQLTGQYKMVFNNELQWEDNIQI